MAEPEGKRRRKSEVWQVHVAEGCGAVIAALGLLKENHGIECKSVTGCPGTSDRLPAVDVAWVNEETDENTHIVACARVASVLPRVGKVLSWKSSLACLQWCSSLPKLVTLVLRGIHEVEHWARAQFSKSGIASKRQQQTGMWILKDALSNSGEGLWILNKQSWRVEVERARMWDHSAVFVAQEYLMEPELWAGTRNKYHLRVYSALTGGLGLLIYGTAFAHIANKPWTLEYDGAGFTKEVHITNVAQNVSDSDLFHGYPTVNVPQDRPLVWQQICDLFEDVLLRCSPFIAGQRSGCHFQHLGADFILDSTGKVYLLEINAPPCLGSQSTFCEDDRVVCDMVAPQCAELLLLMTKSVTFNPSAKSTNSSGWNWIVPPSSCKVDLSCAAQYCKEANLLWDQFECSTLHAMQSTWRDSVRADHGPHHARNVQWTRTIHFTSAAKERR